MLRYAAEFRPLVTLSKSAQDAHEQSFSRCLSRLHEFTAGRRKKFSDGCNFVKQKIEVYKAGVGVTYVHLLNLEFRGVQSHFAAVVSDIRLVEESRRRGLSFTLHLSRT